MKTANELAQEYFAKTPMERLHTTLQDYVYDYMNSKIEQVRETTDFWERHPKDTKTAYMTIKEIQEIVQ